MNELLMRLGHFNKYWIKQILDIKDVYRRLWKIRVFLKESKIYSGLPGAEKIEFLDSHPKINDRTHVTGFDEHYFYQGLWASDLIIKNKSQFHTDIGSDINFISFLTIFLPVMFFDIRPFNAQVKNLSSIAGDIVNLPISSNSLPSLSCLHVIEHIGLGRYGDKLNPYGTKIACNELERILMPGGSLYLSTTIGKPRLCFNAHRISAPEEILDNFPGLKLTNFACVKDDGKYYQNINPNVVSDQNYTCGMYHFIKKLI
jgi:hypothetical protein